MISTRARLTAIYQRQPASSTPVVLIVLAVLFGNILYLSGLANINPISWTAGISHILCHLTCGRPMIDPNVGFITQPLGHQAALDLLHGHLPWWNSFEGLGQPLAGEMQSAALFPLTLLFALPSGLLWFHMSLEITAGVSTYFLARRLDLPTMFASAGGILFALNGTYAWLGNAVLNPVGFLPMLLLGIEMIFDAARGGSRKGWYVTALAVALSLYSGFPEVAYFDGLFCAGWAAVRFFDLPKEFRPTAAKRLGIGAGIGVLLSLPIVVAFYDFYKVANVGSHTAAVAGTSVLTTNALPMFFDPYVYGAILVNHNAAGLWGAIGGYFTVSVSALALVGLFGETRRPLRIFLGAWIFVSTLGLFDVAHARSLWNLIPLVKTATLPRYIMPSMELAMIVLCVLGLMDLMTSRRAKRLFTVASLLMLLVLFWGLYEARSTNQGVVLGHKTRLVYMLLDALPFLALLALLVLGRLTKYRLVPLLVALVLVGESLAMFIVPTGSAAKSIVIDEAPIAYLRQHQGQGRFLDFAVLFPNWGTQYGINSLGAIDLPFPKAYTEFIQTHLLPGLAPSNQFVIHAGMSGELAQENAVLQHFADYQGASVKYLLLPNKVPLIAGLAKLGVTQVFKDDIATIFQMPGSRAFYSTSANVCTVTNPSVNSATVNCPTGPSTLLRTELSMLGWSASVNGRTVPITTVDGVYQSVPVPQGASAVQFNFLPPHEHDAMALALLAALFLCGSWIRGRRDELVHRRH